MSLTDALLLEPHPFDIWIANRTDGIKGSGTASDPYDGGPVLATVKSITLSRSGTLATASLASGHGYVNGDTVLISGATGSDGLFYNGYFTIQNVQATSFQYVMAGTPGGSGTGTITSAKVTGTKLDALLSGLSTNTHVHLGPGFFFTLGYADGLGGTWQTKTGLKIVGSGIDVTTLKLINVAPGSAANYFAISHAMTTAVDAFEVSHLTIDCNMAAANTNAACGGVRVHGSNVLIHRIKVKNWGTRTTSTPCYAIAVIPAQTSDPATEVKNCGIEDCIVVEPTTVAAGAASAGIATALHAGPVSETGAATLEAFGLSPYIRNCFVDGSTAGVVNLTYDFRGISMSWCHAGVVEGNHIHNVKTGGPYSDKTSIREMVVRNNFYKNVVKGPFLNLGNLCTASLPTVGTTLVSVSSGVLTVQVDAGQSHNLKVGDRLKLVTVSHAFEGTYRVDTVVNAQQFTVKTTASGSATTIAAGSKKIFGTNKLVIEGNIVELATDTTGDLMGIDIHDNGTAAPTPDYVHGEVIVRNNKIRYKDGAFETNYAGRGIEVNGAKNLLMHHNVTEVAESTSNERLRNARSGSANYFNNRLPDGTLVRGVNKDTNIKSSELETDADDAFILGMLKRK